MMSKSFFLPNDLYPPVGPNPPIQLGQLIESIYDPGMKLADSKPLDFTKYGMTISEMPVSVVRNFEESGKQSHVETGLFFSALQFLLAKLHVKYDRTQFENMLHDIDQLHTDTIFPTDEYVRASLQQPQVQESLRRGWFQQSVYMVTAIKIAKKGSRMKTQGGESHVKTTKGEIEGGEQGVSVGGLVQHSSKTYHVNGTSFVAEADFIYAFQVRKCHFGSNRVKKDLYTKSALLSGNSLDATEQSRRENEGKAKTEEDVLEFRYDGFSEEDLTTEDLDDSSTYEIFSLVESATGDATSCIGLK